MSYVPRHNRSALPVAPGTPRRRRKVALPAGAALVTLVAIPIAASAASAAASHPATATAATAVKVTTVIPSTTKSLAATTIASVTAAGGVQTIKLTATPTVKAGDYILAGIGTATPQGLIAKVTKVSGTTLTATPATLKRLQPGSGPPRRS